MSGELRMLGVHDIPSVPKVTDVSDIPDVPEVSYISDTPVVPGNVCRVTSVGYLVCLVCLLLGFPNVLDVLMFFKYLI